MATHTRPFLMTGAALASAAAIVVATPQLMPSVTAPTPLALSQAQVELSTFADVFTIPASEFVASYFQGFGGITGGPLNPDYDPNDPEKGPEFFPNEYTGCTYDCFVAGLSGFAYLAGDALINGNGNGWSDKDNWGESAINYFYEGGFSAGAQYVAQNTIGAANPILSTLISTFFLGELIVTQIWDTAWSSAAALISAVPIVGDVIAGGIYAYLGEFGYTPGLTGVLNYVIDLVTDGIPTAAATTSAASLAATPAAAAAAVTAPVTRALNTSSAKAEVAPAAAAVEVSEEKPADENGVDEVKAEVKAGTETEAGTDAPGPDSVESDADEAATVDAPAAGQTETATEAPATEAPATTEDSAPKTRKRPVRAAVEKVTSSISNALKGATAGADAAAETSSPADAS